MTTRTGLQSGSPKERAASSSSRRIVAFANSVPANRIGLLFVGVADDGTILGVENPDKLQKSIRQAAERTCYPPIYVETEVLPTDPGPVVAVAVRSSVERPHFAGLAYVRRGSETVEASKDLFDQLVYSRLDKCRALQEMQGEVCRVVSVGKILGAVGPATLSTTKAAADCRIEAVTPHFVTLSNVGAGVRFTELLESISISYDDARHMPLLIVRWRS
jgi:hypothetical protein